MASKIEVFPADVSDPYGGSAAVYETCLAQLTAYIGQMFFAGEEL